MNVHTTLYQKRPHTLNPYPDCLCLAFRRWSVG